MILECEIDVVRNEQVQVTVGIHIEKIRTRTNFLTIHHARLFRHIGESPIAVVPVQDIRAVVIEVQIGIPIVVVIRHGDSETEPCIPYAGRCRHVRETQTAVVSVERISRSRLAWLFTKGRAVQKVDVDIPVTVIVKQR